MQILEHQTQVYSYSTGLTGMLHFNKNGDRMAEYAINDLNPDTGEMEVSSAEIMSTNRLESV